MFADADQPVHERDPATGQHRCTEGDQHEKMEIMEILDRKGVFLLKGSVSFVAKELHSSEASIYRYLGKLNSRSGK